MDHWYGAASNADAQPATLALLILGALIVAALPFLIAAYAREAFRNGDAQADQ